MISKPKYQVDEKKNKIWLRLPLGSHGEVNHFLDALLMHFEDAGDQKMSVFCGVLMSRERFYKNDLVTSLNFDELPQLLNLLSSFMTVSDPYEEAEKIAKQAASNGTVASKVKLAKASSVKQPKTDIKAAARAVDNRSASAIITDAKLGGVAGYNSENGSEN